jgi:hypothetical protein
MKFSAVLIASAISLLGIADAKIHKLGLKKIPQEDVTVVCALSLRFGLIMSSNI